ncbi:MAG: spinster family MFS transporter [Candidatus Korobacteraceae bacterium]
MNKSQFDKEQVRVLLILALLNFVNYADRQIIFPLFPQIQQEFHLNYTQLGMLATVFTIVLSLGSVPFGVLSDRGSRRKVISFGVLFWSAATFLSGAAQSFRHLLIARGLVGVGEAAYTPAGTSIISETFPQEVRSQVQGMFNVGMFLGGAVGMALGGMVAHWAGWRPAFFVMGVPGLLLGLWALRLPEPARQQKGQAAVPVRALLRVPAYLMILAGSWFISFAGYAYTAWGPQFVQEYKGFTPQEAGVVLGLTLVVAGAAGVMAGAVASDRLFRIAPWARAVVIPIGFLLAAPLTYLGLHAAGKTAFTLLFASGVFFLTWYHGPVAATIHDLIPASGHGTAIGIYTLFVNLFAMAIAPLVVGGIADATNLLTGLLAAVAAQVVGALLFVVAIFQIRRDGLRHPAMEPYQEENGVATELAEKA